MSAKKGTKKKKSIAEMTSKELCSTVFWEKPYPVPKGHAVFTADALWVSGVVGEEEWNKSIRNKFFEEKDARGAYRVRRIPVNGLKIGNGIKRLPPRRRVENVGKPLSFKEQYLLRFIVRNEKGAGEQMLKRSVRWSTNEYALTRETRTYARALAERLGGYIEDEDKSQWYVDIVRKKTNEELREMIQNEVDTLKDEVEFERFVRNPVNRATLDGYAALKMFGSISFNEDNQAMVEAIVDVEGKTQKEIERLLLIDSI
jgi:hypothetical protein